MFESKKSKKPFLLVATVLGVLSASTIFGLTPGAKAMSHEATNSAENTTQFKVDDEGKLTNYEGAEKEVTLPDNVKTISFGAFMNKDKIEKVTLPEGLETIDEYAFYACKALKDINIPDSVKVINRLAFGDCESLENIKLGKGLSLLEKFVFLGCKNLKEILVNPESKNFSSLNGVLYNKDCSELVLYPMGSKDKNVEICENTNSVLSYAFLDCKNLENVFWNGKKTISIYDAAFSGCENLKNINFEDKIDLIGPGAFMKCSCLENFTLGEKVRSVGDSAFLGCTSLKNIISKSKIAQVGHKLFDSCPQKISIRAIANSALSKYAQSHSNHLTLE